jgi:hypothetical protein
MPPAETILSVTAAAANDWRSVSVAWHAVLVAAALAVVAGYRPSHRLLALSMSAPLASVSAVAWMSGNPFNATVLGVLAIALALIAARASASRVRAGTETEAIIGLMLIVFGWTYPHFVRASSWIDYLYSAPFGTVPCPTLAGVVGGTLMLGSRLSTTWRRVVATAGLVYGAVGAVWLGVWIDVVLALGAGTLLVVAGRR